MPSVSALPLMSPLLNNTNVPQFNNNTNTDQAVITAPFFTQHLKSDIHQHPTLPKQSPPLPATYLPSISPPDEDYELLRKYGLDQFTLNSGAANTLILQNALQSENSMSISSISDTTLETTVSSSNIASGMHNWTTFD